jgi:hypothetical protein
MRNWKDALDLKTGLTVDTTGIMTYPTGIDRIISVRAGGDHMLVPTDSAYLMQVDPQVFEQTGNPLRFEDFYDVASGLHKIRVFPIPSASTPISLLGKRTFTQLVADTDAPILRNIDSALIAFGTYDMLQRQRQYAKAQLVLQEAAAALDSMVRAETERSGYQQRIVPYVEDIGESVGFDTSFIQRDTMVALNETGIKQLTSGSDVTTVGFASQKPDATWHLNEAFVINDTDPTPLEIFVSLVTSKTASGFTAQLSASPDSSNYYLHWGVSL